MAHPKWAPQKTQPSPKIYRRSPPIVNDRSLIVIAIVIVMIIVSVRVIVVLTAIVIVIITSINNNYIEKKRLNRSLTFIHFFFWQEYKQTSEANNRLILSTSTAITCKTTSALL